MSLGRQIWYLPFSLLKQDEDAMAMINTCTLEEARYLLEHLLGLAINKVS
jgi:hypothetical protein